MTNVTDEQLGKLARQQADLFRRVREGSLDVHQASKGIQGVIEGKYPRGILIASSHQEYEDATQKFYPARDYGRYDQYLHSLDDQLQLLRDLNQRMPRKLRVPDAWLDLDIDSEHSQGVEDLEFFYVHLDTLEATWAFNQKLVELTQPSIRDSGFRKGAADMRLHSSAHQYAPGIHRVRINLVDNWEPKKGRNIDQVRHRTTRELAAVEPIGAYALQDPRLYQSQDGENLPHFDMAGLEQGVGFARVPYSRWGRISRWVYFGADLSDFVARFYAAPSRVA